MRQRGEVRPRLGEVRPRLGGVRPHLGGVRPRQVIPLGGLWRSYPWALCGGHTPGRCVEVIPLGGLWRSYPWAVSGGHTPGRTLRVIPLGSLWRSYPWAASGGHTPVRKGGGRGWIPLKNPRGQGKCPLLRRVHLPEKSALVKCVTNSATVGRGATVTDRIVRVDHTKR